MMQLRKPLCTCQRVLCTPLSPPSPSVNKTLKVGFVVYLVIHSHVWNYQWYHDFTVLFFIKNWRGLRVVWVRMGLSGLSKLLQADLVGTGHVWGARGKSFTWLR